MTFVVYAVEACLALLIALPLGLELLDDGRASFASALGRAAWLDRVAELLPALRLQSTSWLLHGALLLLVSPWLQMAWLHALAQPSGLGQALAVGAQRYLRAWLVTVWVLLLTALASAPFLLAASVLENLLREGDARLHDLLLAAACLPLLLVWWAAHVLHDLARARALSAGAWAAVSGSLRLAVRPRAQLPAVLFAILALAVHGAAWLLVGRGTLDSRVPALAVWQLSCLLGLFLRSCWLACALACAQLSPTFRDEYE